MGEPFPIRFLAHFRDDMMFQVALDADPDSRDSHVFKIALHEPVSPTDLKSLDRGTTIPFVAFRCINRQGRLYLEPADEASVRNAKAWDERQRP